MRRSRRSNSSSRNFLRHRGWRFLRKILPSGLWSGIYAIRERKRAPGKVRLLDETIRACRDYVDTSNYPLASTLIFGGAQESSTLQIEGLWTRFGAAGKADLGYARVYAPIVAILATLHSPTVLEIGVHLGGSHRTWRSLLPMAQVLGFDVDPDTTICERGIKTVVADQLSSTSIQNAIQELGASGYDLIVDDGWHQPEAALNSLIELLPRLNSGGFYVLEDIDERQYGRLWRSVVPLFVDPFNATLVSSAELGITNSPALGMLVIRRIA